MDNKKFEKKILGMIEDSMEEKQSKYRKKIKLISLIDKRDRYYKVKCNTSKGFMIKIFIRYEKWFWYIDGLKDIPRELKKRHYDSSERYIKGVPQHKKLLLIEQAKKKRDDMRRLYEKTEKELNRITLKKVIRRERV